MNKNNISEHSEYFECSCFACEHTLRFSYFEDVFENKKCMNKTFDIYLHFFLENGPWYRRLWLGIKYIFGYKCKYGHFGEWIMRHEDVCRLKEMLEKFEKFYEENPK